MRHSVFGRKLSRSKNERRRLLQGLARDVIIHGSIRTSLAKAKAVQPMVEKLVTMAKNGSVQEMEKILAHKDIEKMLIDDAKTRFAKRASGFTRIIKLGKRLGDATEEVFLQFVDVRVIAEVVKPKAVKAPEVKVVKPVRKVAKKSVKK